MEFPIIKKYRMDEGWWGCTPLEGDEPLDLALDCMQGFIDKLILEFQNKDINKRYAALGVLLRFLNETSNIWLKSCDLNALCSWAMEVRWSMLDNEMWRQGWSNPDVVYDWLTKFPKALITAILRQGRDLPPVLQEWVKDNGLTIKTFMNESTSYFLYTFTKNVPKETVTQKNWLKLFPWDKEGRWVEQQSLLPNKDGYVWKVECPNDSTSYNDVRFISVKPIYKI